MKILSMLILVLFMGKGCEEEAKLAQSTLLEYTRNTRGFYEKITVQNQMVTISRDRSGEKNQVATKIPDTDWKELVSAFNEVKLDEVPSMKGPTGKRFYDGAAMAELKITYDGKEYQSQTFDHGNPPEGMAKLVNKITSLSKQ